MEEEGSDMPHRVNLSFREVQKFRSLWLWLIIISIALIEAGVFGYLIAPQLILGKPLGNSPKLDTLDLIIGTFSFLIGIGILLLLYSAKLTTEVRNDGLYIRFFPFHLSYHKIPLEDLKRCKARTYYPIGEYGGWGIRYARKDKAYNVSGNLGVRLDYSDGRHLLIGSQRPEELAQAIESVLK